MKFHFCMICLLRFIVLISEASRSQSFVTRPEPSARQTKPFSVPTYNVSAGGFSSAARGWNSWGLQANPLTNYAGFVFNDYHFLQQCGLIVTTPGYDYYCSIDSGWSADQGDEYGRFVEDKSIFSTTGSLANFSDQIHGMGMKVGIYLLPGAFEVDAGTTIENTTLKIGDILDYETPSYFSRRAFNWSADGVQQWHDSVIKHLASVSVTIGKCYTTQNTDPQLGAST